MSTELLHTDSIDVRLGSPQQVAAAAKSVAHQLSFAQTPNCHIRCLAHTDIGVALGRLRRGPGWLTECTQAAGIVQLGWNGGRGASARYGIRTAGSADAGTRLDCDAASLRDRVVARWSGAGCRVCRVVDGRFSYAHHARHRALSSGAWDSTVGGALAANGSPIGLGRADYAIHDNRRSSCPTRARPRSCMNR